MECSHNITRTPIVVKIGEFVQELHDKCGDSIAIA